MVLREYPPLGRGDTRRELFLSPNAQRQEVRQGHWSRPFETLQTEVGAAGLMGREA
jgi:hypothetical protein